MLVARGFNAYRKQEQRIHGDRGKSARGERGLADGGSHAEKLRTAFVGILRMGGSRLRDISLRARTTPLRDGEAGIRNNRKNSYRRE